jgi:hypothetical protein
MRLLSSSTTVQNAENVTRMIVNTYLAPNKTFPELRDMVNNGAIDPLRDSSEACRDDLLLSITHKKLGIVVLRFNINQTFDSHRECQSVGTC